MSTQLDPIEAFLFESIPLNPLALLIFTIFALIVINLFRKRAGSSYWLTNRVYHLLSGTRDFDNGTLRSFRKEVMDIELFNVLFNLQAKSLNEILLFRKWLFKFDLNIRYFSDAYEWFHIGTRKLRRPGKLHICFAALNLTASMFFLLSSFSLIALSTSNEVLVIIKKSDNWIWLKEDSATDFSLGFNNNWLISQKMCEDMGSDFEAGFKKQAIEPEYLSLHDLVVVCNAITKNTSKDEISKMIEKQRWLSIPALILFLLSYFFINLIKSLASAYSARAHVYRKIKTIRSIRS